MVDMAWGGFINSIATLIGKYLDVLFK
jgi:hypothetical protein